MFSNQTDAIVVGNLSFSGGNDDLYFYANSTVTGSIDGGGGENRLFLAGAAGSSDELTNTLSHFQTITKTGAGQWTISGSIKGTTASPVRSVRVEEGTLRLTGNNENFTGDLSINTNEDGSVGMHPDAVLEARAQSLPTNTTGNTANIKNYGTLRFVNDDTGTYVGQIIGTGKVEMTGSGTVVLAPQAGSNTYEGGTYVENGTLGISADSALGAVTGDLVLGDGTNIGTLQFQGNFNLDSSRSISLIGGGGAFDTNGFNTTISQAFAYPSDNLYKKGAGTLTLTGDSSLLGSTYIQEGTLQLGTGGTTGSVGGVYIDISAGAALAYNHSNNVTDSTNIIGAGRVIQRGTGTLELTGQYTATTPFTGGTELETGKILISDKNAYNKTTGTANNAGQFLYASNGSGTTRTIEVASTVDQLTNHFHVASGTSNILQINGDLEISGVTNSSPTQNLGGAIYVAGGMALDLNVGKTGQSDIDLTFENNKYGSTANDIYLDSSGILNLNVSGADGTSTGNAVFIDSGIGGQGTISVNGPGLVQISKNSQADQTIVSKSTMRLVDGMRYTSSYDQDTQSSLQGTGTIDASGTTGGSITIAGTISPDKAKFTSGSDTIAAADRVGKLALVGAETKLDSGFTYEYDVTAANTSKDPAQTQNDLVQFGTQTVTIANGTIDFRTETLDNGKQAAFKTGRYLLFDSPGATYVDAAGNAITDLNNGIFTTLINGSSFIYPSPRRALQYEFDNQNGNPANSQIWLDYLVNSLTMDWTGGATGNPVGGTWNDTLENWNSQQLVDGNLHERVFMDGDKVHLYNNTATAIAINITEDATVSGMVAGRSSGNSTFIGDVTITGTGGITSDAASAFGIYLPDGNGTPTLTPTGKLELFGSYDNNTTPETLMTLTLANTGKNEFLEGIDIYGGKLALSGKENRLGTYAATTGNAGLVTFKVPSDPEVQKHVVEVNLAQTLQNRFVVEGGVLNAFIIANANTTISGITSAAAIELQDNSNLTLQANGTSNLVLTGNGTTDVKMGEYTQLTVTGTGNTFVRSGMQGATESYLIKDGDGTLQIEANSDADHISIDNGMIRVFDEKTLGNADTSSFYVALDTQHGPDSKAVIAGAGTVQAKSINVQGHISPDNLDAADATKGSRYGTLTLEGSTSIVMKGFAMDFDLTTPTAFSGSTMTNDQDLLVVNGAVVNAGTNTLTGSVAFRTVGGVFDRGAYLVIQSSDGYNLSGDGINGIGHGGALTATINGRDAAEMVATPRKTIKFELRNENKDVWLVNDMNSLTMDWTGGTGTVLAPVSGDWVYTAPVMESLQDDAVNRETYFMDGDKVHISSNTAVTVNLAETVNPIVSGLVAGQSSDGTIKSGDVTITGKGGITADASTAFGEYVQGANPQGTPILTPTGKLQKYGTGTLTFANTGSNTFTEGIDIDAGIVKFNDGRQLQVGSGKALTFTGNGALQATSTAKLETDVVINTGIVASFGTTLISDTLILDGLVSGPGYVEVISGTVQLNRGTTIFTGETIIENGTLRLLEGLTYKTVNFQVRLGDTSVLAGAGTYQADMTWINGRISPDTYKDDVIDGVVQARTGDKFAKLTIDGGGPGRTAVLNGFTFDYDAKEANTTTGAADTPNDLLKFTNMRAVTIGDGLATDDVGTINFRTGDENYLAAGKYLIIDSNTVITLQHSTAVTSPDELLAGQITRTVNGADVTTDFENLSPRTWYAFRWNDETGNSGNNESTNPETQIWLDATLNSLTMDWTGGSATWNATDSTFTSLQTSGDGTVRESVFRNGDKVHFAGNTDYTVELGSDVLVSGLVVGKDSGTDGTDGNVYNTNMTIFGDYGITARLAKTVDETDIIGKFIGDTLIPTGYLDKYGEGTLTFTNTGGNTFTQGIDINEGTVGFNRADQLLVGTGKKITFQGSFMKPATLRADATTDLNTAVHVDEEKFGWLHAGLDGEGQEIAMLVRAAVSAEVKPLSILYKTGAGIVQISAESTEFRATTMVMEGTFRVTDGVTYGDETKAQIFFSPEANTETTLAGSGIIAGQFFGIGENAGFAENNRSVISPDKANLTVDNLAISEDDKFGTLTLRSDGNGIVYFYSDPDEPNNTQDGFWFDYDVNAPNTSVTDTTNDLLVLDGMSNVRLHGGVVNFRTGTDGLGSGEYLIIDSNVTIKDGTDKDYKDGHLTQDGVYLDGINDYATNGGVLWGKINGEDIRTGSPRRELGFELREGQAVDSQIWLTVDRNTLTMVRTVGGVWNSTDASQSWVSEQENDVTHEKEHVIERGDYAKIYNTNAASFTITGSDNQRLSGLQLGETGDSGDVIIDGDFGLRTVTEDVWIEGDYVDLAGTPASKTPVVPVDGKLTKRGDHTATFANTGGNLFQEGIDLYAGTLSFNHADQLLVGGQGITGKVLAFKDTAVLRADATTDLDTDVVVDNGVTGTLETGPGISMLVNETISGGGTLKKTGDGTVQLNTSSTAFTGTASVDEGIFRVVDTVSFGSATSTLNVTRQGDDFGTIAGAGTFTGDTVTVNGNISPDSFVDQLDGTQDGDKIGTLTLDATNVTFGDGFVFQYDTGTPRTDGNPSNTATGDLLQIRGTGGSVLLVGGKVNLSNAPITGDYLIIDSNRTITVDDGKGNTTLDGIEQGGVLAGTTGSGANEQALSNDTPRGMYEFRFEDFNGVTASQVWLSAKTNSLTMDRSTGGKWSDNVWSSEQTAKIDKHETQFRDGDYAKLSGTAEIDIETPVITSGVDVSGDGTVTLTGQGGILATSLDGSAESDWIEGEFLAPNGRDPQLDPNGKLQKSGDGTLVFRNTGGNTFREGIFLSGGITAFNKANQLGTVDTSNVDNGINFIDDATLRADTTTLIYNTINISDTKTATLETAVEDVVWTYAGQMNGGPTSAFDKIGAGTLDLRRAPEDDPHVAFSGKATVTGGTLGVYADYRNVTQFTVKDKATLTGTGILGATTNGGVIQSGGTLAPGGLSTFTDATTAPVENPLTIVGNLSFEAGSNFDVRITQFGTGADGKYVSYSDRVAVTGDGTVSIDAAANLNVDIDFWGDTLTINDFNAEESSKFTVIDATDGSAEDEAAQFTLNLSEILPRGVKLVQGWQNYENGWMDFGNGWLYQLWFEDDSDNNFENICDRHNRVEIGSVLDDLVWSKDPGMKDLIDHLSDPSLSDKEVCDILDWLHGDIGPNSMMMALKKPWRHPFNRLDFGQFQACDPCGPTMSKNRQKRQLWGEFLARYDDVRSDRNAHPFTVNRFGVAVGVDQRLSRRLIVGANFQYSDPRLRQETGKTEMDDYEAGIYGLAKLNDRWEMKLYAGYSHQRYDIDRRVYIPAAGNFAALNERFKSKTDGDAFSASVELIRPMRVGQNLRLLPLIALDIEKAWMDGYRESGGLTALVYDNSSLERIMMRFGMQAEFNVRNNLDLQARIQYATQLNSTEYPRTRVSFANATVADLKTADIWGSRIGRDYLNLGVGADWKLNRKRSLSLFVNYDVDLYNRATVHAGEAGIVRQW